MNTLTQTVTFAMVVAVDSAPWSESSDEQLRKLSVRLRLNANGQVLYTRFGQSRHPEHDALPGQLVPRPWRRGTDALVVGDQVAVVLDFEGAVDWILRPYLTLPSGWERHAGIQDLYRIVDNNARKVNGEPCEVFCGPLEDVNRFHEFSRPPGATGSYRIEQLREEEWVFVRKLSVADHASAI